MDISTDDNTFFNTVATNKCWFLFIISFWGDNSISKWRSRYITSINSILSTYQCNISFKIKSRFKIIRPILFLLQTTMQKVIGCIFSPNIYCKLTFLKNNLSIHFIVKISGLIIDCIMKTFFSRNDYCPALVTNFCCV